MSIPAILRDVLRESISQIRQHQIAVFTFALYFDHESSAVSVCVDTEESSAVAVSKINRYNAKHFRSAVDGGDLKSAALWQANIGRSFSLGDFAAVNIARTDLPGTILDAELELELVRALIEVQDEILKLAKTPESVLFACSGVNDEVALVWSAGGVA